ncbi:MAG TPA: hypothetical protein VF756_28330 [Thermoanaerobaculia bacterium]
MSSMYGRSLSLLVLGSLLGGGSLDGATLPDHPWCGTSRSGLAAHAAIHEDHQRRREGERGKAVRTFPEAARAGDVAVLVDDGSMVVQPNPLDLSDFGVQYVPQRRGGLVAAPSGDPVAEEVGQRIDLGDDDSREVAFPRGFRFPFFGRVHTRMFVHSDGNLTFVAPDAGSSERSLDRLIGGPPRIAPLFADLNPEAAAGNGGVYVLASPARVVVTWLDLPEFGQLNRNTFQAVLYPNGRITFAFGELSAREAVVGVAPGGGGQVQLLDYRANLPTGVIRAGIAERFARTRSFDHLAVARAFFREFADIYDHLIVFLDFPQSLGGGFAFELTVKNDIRGIGLGLFDHAALVGSRGRLRSFVQMGTLARYPDDPHAEFLGTNSTLDVLGQEAGHRWLSFLHFVDENGAVSDALLGRDLAHWSFCHNSLASDMEGNEYQEDGGDRFTTIAATDRFSPLDQYAMGLIPAAQVPPFYYVDGCSVERSASPEIGVTVQGRRVDVTIGQIVAAEGPRVPDSRRAPRSFNMAFILVAEGGQFPSAESITKVDRFRAAWESYFVQATDGRGSVSTVLRLKPRR